MSCGCMSVMLTVLLLYLALSGHETHANCDSSEPLDVSMDLHTLNLVRGRTKRVSCDINRPFMDLLGSTVEFILLPRETPSNPNPPRRILTRNGVLVEASPSFYSVNVRSEGDSTTHELVYRNPRPEDEGHLKCLLTPARRIAPRGVASISSSRYVLVYEP